MKSFVQGKTSAGRFEKWRNSPGCNTAGGRGQVSGSRARRVWSAPGWVGSGGTLDCDEKIVSRKRIFKKNHRQSCRNIGIPENHKDSWWVFNYIGRTGQTGRTGRTGRAGRTGRTGRRGRTGRFMRCLWEISSKPLILSQGSGGV